MRFTTKLYSTVSSGLNSLAAVVWEDFFKPLFGSKITDQQATFISKMIGNAQILVFLFLLCTQYTFFSLCFWNIGYITSNNCSIFRGRSAGRILYIVGQQKQHIKTLF